MIKIFKKIFIPEKTNNYHPHFVRRKSLTILFLVVVISFMTSRVSSYLIRNTNLGAAVLSSVLVDLTNNHRLENNEKPLLVSKTLESAALMKAKDMADNQYFAHTSPQGITPWQWFYKAGYNFIYAGENLAISFTESSDVEKAWINSPTHHANLLNDKFTETGIATYDGLYQGQHTIFVVQLFGSQSKSMKPSVIEKNITPKQLVAIATPDKLSTTTLSPKVKGESISVLVEDSNFIAVQNVDEQGLDVNKIEVPYVKQSNLIERLLVNQPRYVQTFYLILSILISMTLLLMVFKEFRVHNLRNMTLGIIFLGILLVMVFLNTGYILHYI